MCRWIPTIRMNVWLTCCEDSQAAIVLTQEKLQEQTDFARHG